MIYCAKCGKQNADNAKFCTACGTNLSGSKKHPESEIIQSPPQASQPSWQQDSPTQPVEPLIKFVSKYQKLGIVIIFLLLAFIPLYYFFIKATPSKDAKKLAAMLCSCRKDSVAGNSKVINEFVSNFKSRQFKSRSEARNFINAELQKNQFKYDSCTNQASEKYNEYFKRYSKKRRKDLLTFQRKYSTAYNNCNNAEVTNQSTIYQQVEEKINKIIDPLPDIEKIKTDLIGYSIPGWNFEYLSEYKKCEIVNESKGAGRTEYLVNLTLLGQSNSNPHDAQVRLVYFQSDDGWYLSEVKEIFITYINTAPLNDWLKITPLQNCTYSISNDKKYWIKEGDYGQTYKGGPDGEPFHLTSSYIYIQSRETEPVNLVFTYRPKE